MRAIIADGCAFIAHAEPARVANARWSSRCWLVGLSVLQSQHPGGDDDSAGRDFDNIPKHMHVDQAGTTECSPLFNRHSPRLPYASCHQLSGQGAMGLDRQIRR